MPCKASERQAWKGIGADIQYPGSAPEDILAVGKLGPRAEPGEKREEPLSKNTRGWRPKTWRSHFFSVQPVPVRLSTSKQMLGQARANPHSHMQHWHEIARLCLFVSRHFFHLVHWQTNTLPRACPCTFLLHATRITVSCTNEPEQEARAGRCTRCRPWKVATVPDRECMRCMHISSCSGSPWTVTKAMQATNRKRHSTAGTAARRARSVYA